MYFARMMTNLPTIFELEQVTQLDSYLSASKTQTLRPSPRAMSHSGNQDVICFTVHVRSHRRCDNSCGGGRDTTRTDTAVFTDAINCDVLSVQRVRRKEPCSIQ